MFDLRLKFGIKKPEYFASHAFSSSRLHKRGVMSSWMIIVDAVSTVLKISAEEIEKALFLVPQISTDFIPGMTKIESRGDLINRRW